VDNDYGHIKSANSRVKLIDVLRSYGIKIEKNYQRPTWSNNIKCPFPNHKGSKERTPSFGYCFVSDHFHCFGCNSTGRAVEFISLYESIPRGLVVERILSKYGEEDTTSQEFKDYEDDISPILLDAAKFFQSLIKKHKNNPKKMKHIHDILWWIDFYMMQKTSKNISAKELQHRISRAKELLSDE
jgi:DNA primase